MLFDPNAPFTVTQLNRRVKNILERQPEFQGVQVRGELSNVVHHTSGHLYFTLKDAESELAGVMYRSALAKNTFQQFQNGDQVVATGDITVYEPKGRYQLLTQRLQPEGVGELYKRFLRLKEKLATEGLFDESRKRKLPAYPRRIALITSATGAVLRDIMAALERRGAKLLVTLLPATVQGAEGLPSLLKALYRAQELPGVEAIILARGGGSIEDLWCFNEEALARAVAASSIPVVSAIGHQTDFTITDFVADLRAPTPTAAAELIAPSEEELLGELGYHQSIASQAVRQLVRTAEQRQDEFELAGRAAVAQQIRGAYTDIARLAEKVAGAARFRHQAEMAALGQLESSLAALNPEAALARGYSFTTKNGRRVRSATDIHIGDVIQTHLVDGMLLAEVKEVTQTPT